MAWTYDFLNKRRVTNDNWQNEDIAIFFDTKNVKGKIFKRRFKDQLLTFEFVDGILKDKETSTSWNIDTGEGIDGKFNGEFLTPIPAIPSYRKSWMQFYPKSKLK